METFELFQRLSVALAIGLLIGLEREWQARDEANAEQAAGLRTLALAGLLGGVWGALAAGRGDAGFVALAIAFAAFSIPIVAFRYRESIVEGSVGATTVVAAMLTFALGAMAVVGDMRVAGAGGVTVAVLLALKPILHRFVEQITWAEMRSGLMLLAMTFILLPLLPNRTVDPLDAINPYELWLLTILIAAISFAGYLAIKLVGARQGILLTGITGGLASSTAVTVSLSRLARDNPARTRELAAGVLAAGATMFARVLVVVGVVNASLVGPLALPLGFAAVTLAFAALWLAYKAAAPESSADGVSKTQDVVLKNPFELPTVLKFGVVLTVVAALAKVATGALGNAGAYALAALSGIADVDALTLSMARLSASGAITPAVAVTAISIVVAVNTISKAALGWWSGGPELGRTLALASAAAIAAGAAGLIVSHFLA